ncbi:MAG: hypothetical protein AAGC96_12260, partial [Pseudomonadota bacterium]
VTEMFRIGRMDAAAQKVSVNDHYEVLAIARSLDEINAARRTISRTALKKYGSEPDPAKSWHDADAMRIDRGQSRINELIDGGEITIPRLTVAGGMLGDLARERN